MSANTTVECYRKSCEFNYWYQQGF